MAMTTQHYTIINLPGKLLSAAEYALLPDEPGWRMELDRGKVVKMPAVKDPLHDWILSNLHDALSPYVKQHRLGAVTWEQVGYDITQPGEPEESTWMPDLAFVRTEHARQVLEARQRGEYPHLAPDLVVEVVSPSQSKADMTERAHRWLAAGTRLLWAIWPNQQQVDMWQPDEPMQTLSARERLDGLDVVPGFTMLVADLFIIPFDMK
ncbi:MAG TPA: Uma2 family endonuclease [Ktedonobacterales bacterium]|jgi:Uma2 family endonuclease